eukprot:TRINITY_DN2621_c1_g1_i2.p1 TRINITY_DN2621_c1_g1~~TRINITY_DN2621_c1_g1_i2.p1  ORF type:complete len:563 (+),score=112.21 TRINITY_DN2621_c1_g1_i2:50-1738(+)
MSELENLSELQSLYDKLQEQEDELIEKVGEDKDYDNIEFVKLTIRDTRDGFPTTKPAVSGIQLIQIDGEVSQFETAWCNTWSSSIKPGHIIDGRDDTAWRDEKLRPVILQLKEPTTLMGYRMKTSLDEPDADPKNWILEGATEKDGPWVLIHDQSEDADMPKDRSKWGVIIPMSYEDGDLMRAIRATDSAEQEVRYARLEKEESLEASRTGPTKEDIAELTKKSIYLREKNRLASDTEKSKNNELQRYHKETSSIKDRTVEFCTKLNAKMEELISFILDHKSRGAAAVGIDVMKAVDTLVDIEQEREKELRHLQTESDNSKSDDCTLTQSLTELQNRCVIELPKLREEAEAAKRSMAIACQREINDLAEVYRNLEIKNKELSFHTKRGTNFKIKWKDHKGDETSRTIGGDEGFTSSKNLEENRRREDENIESSKETLRLRRMRADLRTEYTRVSKEYDAELSKLKKTFSEVHKERSLLGTERCELEAICAEFSSVIEQFQEKLRNPMVAGKTKLIPPLSTKFTIGHGRLSPRPMASPRRSYSPRPHSRATTPRVSVTPRRHH